MPKRISEEKKQIVKEFCKDNKKSDASKLFGISTATISRITGTAPRAVKKERVASKIFFRHEDYLGGLV